VRLLFWNRYSKEERVDLDVYEDENRPNSSATGGCFKFLKSSDRVTPVTEPGNDTKDNVDDADDSSRTATLATTMESTTEGIVCFPKTNLQNFRF